MLGGLTDCASLWRQSTRRLLRQSGPSEISMDSIFTGAMAPDCACYWRVSSLGHVIRRSCSKARLSSIRLMVWIPRTRFVAEQHRLLDSQAYPWHGLGLVSRVLLNAVQFPKHHGSCICPELGFGPRGACMLVARGGSSGRDEPDEVGLSKLAARGKIGSSVSAFPNSQRRK
jgi:hypothetical protein